MKPLTRGGGRRSPPPTSPALFTGPLEFECQVLHIAETGQRLIAYCAAPGSATEAAFAELSARAPAGTYDAAGVLLKCGTARRVAPSGERTTRMPEDNEHGL